MEGATFVEQQNGGRHGKTWGLHQLDPRVHAQPLCGASVPVRCFCIHLFTLCTSAPLGLFPGYLLYDHPLSASKTTCVNTFARCPTGLHRACSSGTSHRCCRTQGVPSADRRIFVHRYMDPALRPDVVAGLGCTRLYPGRGGRLRTQCGFRPHPQKGKLPFTTVETTSWSTAAQRSSCTPMPCALATGAAD